MDESLYKRRIWEVDHCRGVALCVVLVLHFYAIVGEYGPLDVTWRPFFYFVKQYWGAYFVFLSGLCAYLGSKSVKRGIIVFCCGMLLTAATVWLYKSGRQGEDVLIQWGVLHLIGFCMIVYPLFKNLKPEILIAIGIIIIAVGYYLDEGVRVVSKYLFPLGLTNPWFCAWDYYPIMPHLGWFIGGVAAGKLIYPTKQTIFPNTNTDKIGLRITCWIGRNSLFIFMLSFPLYYIIAINL